MSREYEAIDISGIPAVLSLIEEVHRGQEPRVLQRDGEDLAVVTPLVRGTKKHGCRPKSDDDYEAFRRAAGGWADIDTDTLIKNIYEDRRNSTRPPVEL